jgi:hypothetical protein
VTKEGVLAWVWAAWCGCSERLRTPCKHGTVVKAVDGWIGARVQQHALELGPKPGDEGQQSS